MKLASILILAFAGNAIGQECVDSDGDGWGWNGTASCIVSATLPNECDYSNAGSNGGWGWNPVTGTSCPPDGVRMDDPVACVVEPIVQDQGLAAVVVGDWFCRLERFEGGMWESFTDNTWRMTFSSNGSATSQDLTDEPEFIAPTLAHTWRADGFDFYFDEVLMSQVSVTDGSWAYYPEPSLRRVCFPAN